VTGAIMGQYASSKIPVAADEFITTAKAQCHFLA
jgi:hypothetical protein